MYFSQKNRCPNLAHPLTYLRLNSKAHFWLFFFNKSCSNVTSDGVFFYHKSKSPHSSVIFRGLKSYFSQKVRCPNLAHPPNLLEIKLKKHIFWPIFFNKSCSNVTSDGVFFYHKSKSPHSYVVIRTLKSYFSQKNRCPNLAHPP